MSPMCNAQSFQHGMHVVNHVRVDFTVHELVGQNEIFCNGQTLDKMGPLKDDSDLFSAPPVQGPEDAPFNFELATLSEPDWGLSNPHIK